MQTNPKGDVVVKNANVDKLQECLRSELSAVETYEAALKTITHVGLHGKLQEILASHGRRTEMLREKVMRSGAEPATSSGARGAFAKALQAGADLLSDRLAIMALEEGEDRAIKIYSEGLNDVDGETRRFLKTDLLPEQRRTHEACKALKTYVSAPS